MRVELRGARDEQAFELRRVGQGGSELGLRTGIDQGCGRARVGEEVLDRVRLELRVDHDHDGAGLEDAEECRDPVGRVVHRDDHPLLGLHARSAERMGEAAGARIDLGVGQIAGVRAERDSIAAPFAHPIGQEPVGDVELLGNHYRIIVHAPDDTGAGGSAQVRAAARSPPVAGYRL